MGRKLGEGVNLLLTGPKGELVEVHSGEPLPDWAKGMVGDHVYGDAEDRSGLIDGQDPDDDDQMAAADGDVPTAKKAAPAKRAAAKKAAGPAK